MHRLSLPFLMRLKFQERSELKFVSRIIPRAKRSGINDTAFESEANSNLIIKLICLRTKFI